MTERVTDLGSIYGRDVYADMATRALASAEVVIPLLLESIAAPSSVVDYGGGTGEWAAALRRHGAEEVLVVDGPWVDRSRLAVAADEFREHDVQERFTAGRAFDLALCLEVAGHVAPEHEAAFVDTLAGLAPMLLFSAPVPGQPGVGDGWLNNRWPAYWAEAFAARGMAWVDPLRLRIWDDPRVTWWYAQNLALVVREDVLATLPALAAHRRTEPLALVHPDLLTWVTAPPGPRALLRALPGSLIGQLRGGRGAKLS